MRGGDMNQDFRIETKVFLFLFITQRYFTILT